jgi:nucleoid-associated protein YgaU
MNNPGIFQNNAATNSFPPTSRYYGIEIATFKSADGRTVAYVRRRFVPQPDRFALLLEHTVVKGDRLDNLAAQYLGDPEQFWRIADANRALQPEELTAAAGSKVRITLPEGIPAPPHA